MFFHAAQTAVECSAAFPTKAITITPTKVSVKPESVTRGLDRSDEELA